MNESPQATLVRQVVDDYLRRRAAGEAVSEEVVAREHPHLQPALEMALSRARLVAQARRTAEEPRNESPLCVVCPHCRNKLDTPTDAAWHAILCSHCGQTFSLTGSDADENTFAAGHTIGHFELLTKLGEGGFGTVWTARDTHLDRLVAVKMPRRGLLTPREADLFLREARAVAQLRHPNIVAVHEVGREGETVYIVSELIYGVSLADWAQGHLSPGDVARLCGTVARALHHAHQAGVIHRDLKPSNILIDPAGEPHLVDFGLAKRESADTVRTATGQMIGTPAYMSPEQARGAAHDCTGQSDVYSLGVVLYELITGEAPFRGHAPMVLTQIVADEPPSPRRFAPDLPRDLETICLKCLEKDPMRRYAAARWRMTWIDSSPAKRFSRGRFRDFNARPDGAGGIP